VTTSPTGTQSNASAGTTRTSAASPGAQDNLGSGAAGSDTTGSSAPNLAAACPAATVPTTRSKTVKLNPKFIQMEQLDMVKLNPKFIQMEQLDMVYPALLVNLKTYK
jgi:hypothetical protein